MSFLSALTCSHSLLTTVCYSVWTLPYKPCFLNSPSVNISQYTQNGASSSLCDGCYEIHTERERGSRLEVMCERGVCCSCRRRCGGGEEREADLWERSMSRQRPSPPEQELLRVQGPIHGWVNRDIRTNSRDWDETVSQDGVSDKTRGVTMHSGHDSVQLHSHNISNKMLRSLFSHDFFSLFYFWTIDNAKQCAFFFYLYKTK